jgi:hypothetical protein
MEHTLTTSPSFAHRWTAYWIPVAVLAIACGIPATAQTAPSISWYTLAGSDFNPLTGQTQTLGIQVFLHCTDPQVVAFRATAAVQVGKGLGSPALQGTATNVLDDTDTMVYIPVTPNSANASLQTLWILVELILADGSTFSSLQRLPVPWQSYPIAMTASIPVSRATLRR